LSSRVDVTCATEIVVGRSYGRLMRNPQHVSDDKFLRMITRALAAISQSADAADRSWVEGNWQQAREAMDRVASLSSGIRLILSVPQVAKSASAAVTVEPRGINLNIVTGGDRVVSGVVEESFLDHVGEFDPETAQLMTEGMFPPGERPPGLSA